MSGRAIGFQAFVAPLPENWKPCKTTDTEEIYYFNFATGQSTWDHPCDEFYRNLYEENKKKRTGGGIGGKKLQDGDEKKKKKEKETEDVVELLGRRAGSGGKKKKAVALSKAAPLGPPALGRERGNPLEKKPLAGLSGKLGVLGSGGGGPTLGGLKAASSLGRLKEETKDADESNDDGGDSSDEQPTVALGGLSKPPLGGLLSRKPLPLASSASASVPRRDAKAAADELAADFELQKQKILAEQAAATREMEEAHGRAVEALREQLQQQLRAVEEEGATQRKRELTKKLNDLENQFDRDENALLRERKEKLKRLGSDGDAALAQKRQDLERELKAETGRLEARHDATLRELKEAHEREEKALEATLAAALGDKARDASAVSELKSESERLAGAVASLGSDLEAVRSERDALKHAKSEAERSLQCAEQETAALQHELTSARESHATASNGSQSSRAEALAQELAALKTELDAVRNGRSDADAKLQDAQREAGTLCAAVTSQCEQLATVMAELAALTKELEAA
ncbi:hypothetical protein PybrP1_004815, partial [[Pythium] brassicae (nom. inval.)]